MTLGLKRGAPSNTGPGAVAPFATPKGRLCSVQYRRHLTHSSAHLAPTVVLCSDVPVQMTWLLQVSEQLDADNVSPCLLAAMNTEEKYVWSSWTRPSSSVSVQWHSDLIHTGKQKHVHSAQQHSFLFGICLLHVLDKHSQLQTVC
jgi:hypothetical protein